MMERKLNKTALSVASQKKIIYIHAIKLNQGYIKVKSENMALTLIKKF